MVRLLPLMLFFSPWWIITCLEFCTLSPFDFSCTISSVGYSLSSTLYLVHFQHLSGSVQLSLLLWHLSWRPSLTYSNVGAPAWSLQSPLHMLVSLSLVFLLWMPFASSKVSWSHGPPLRRNKTSKVCVWKNKCLLQLGGAGRWGHSGCEEPPQFQSSVVELRWLSWRTFPLKSHTRCFINLVLFVLLVVSHDTLSVCPATA